MYKLIFTPLLIIFALDFVADDNKLNIEAGQTWLLESKSNRLSISNSEVLFFFQAMLTIHIRQEDFLIGINFL